MKKTIAYIIAVVLLMMIMGLNGCSRGGDSDSAGPVAEYTAKGKIVLPAGSTLAMSDLTVAGCVATVTPESGGSFTIGEPGAGPALVFVYDKNGRLVLMGFVEGDGDTPAEISVKSTAVALLFQQICAYTLMPSSWKEALAVIAAHANTDTLAGVIAARLAANPAALESGDAQIRDTLVAAAEAIIPETMRSSTAGGKSGYKSSLRKPVMLNTSAASVAAITITSASLQSGIQIGANPDDDGFILTNNFRRHIWYWVYVTGYQDADGVDHKYNLATWVDVTDAYLSSTNGLAGALGSSIDAWWGNVAYKPVNSPPIGISFVPENARKMHMAVVTAGAGSKSLDLPAQIAGSPNASDWANGKAGMQAVTFFKDFMLPALFTFIPADAVGRLTGKQLTDLSWDVISLCTQSGFDAATAIASNDWYGALKTVAKGIATDEKLRERLGSLIATKVLSQYATATTAGLLTNSAVLLQKALKVVDYAYLGIDFVAISKDCAASDVYNYFTLTATPPVVRIEPSPASVHPGMSVNLTTYKNIATAGSYTYSYSTDGKYGTLTAGSQSGIKFDSTSETVTYNCKPDTVAGSTETMKVVVERRITTDTGYRMDTIGEATVTVTITAPTLTIDPSPKSVSNSSTALFTAKYDGAVSGDSRMMYRWKSTSKAGHLLNAGGVETDDYTTSSASLSYKAGTSNGNDTITVEFLLVVGGTSYSLGKASSLVTVTNGNYTTAGEKRIVWQCLPSGLGGQEFFTAFFIYWKKPVLDYPYYKITLHTNGNDLIAGSDDYVQMQNVTHLYTNGATWIVSKNGSGGHKLWDHTMLLNYFTCFQNRSLIESLIGDDELAELEYLLGTCNNNDEGQKNLTKNKYDILMRCTSGWTYDVEGSMTPFE